MRKLRFTLSMLGLALAAIPASATISYTSCSSGCSSTSGSYATMPSELGATGLAFSSPITFVSAGLQATGVYIDTGIGTGGTGTVFTNYSSGGSVDALTHLNNGYLIQSSYGTNTGFEIDLPANTYAFAMYAAACSSTCSGFPFGSATVGVGTESSHGSSYNLTFPTGGPAQFFGIVSDTPITSIFLSSTYNNAYLSLSSFEIGQDLGSPAPEAATFFTMGAGLIGLYFLRRPISLRLRTLLRATGESRDMPLPLMSRSSPSVGLT